jgi:hypothetical protein
MPKIRVTINKVGGVKAEGEGFVQGQCHTSMAPILSVFSGGTGIQTSEEKPDLNVLDEGEHEHIAL